MTNQITREQITAAIEALGLNPDRVTEVHLHPTYVHWSQIVELETGLQVVSPQGVPVSEA